MDYKIGDMVEWEGGEGRVVNLYKAGSPVPGFAGRATGKGPVAKVRVYAEGVPTDIYKQVGLDQVYQTSEVLEKAAETLHNPLERRYAAEDSEVALRKMLDEMTETERTNVAIELFRQELPAMSELRWGDQFSVGE